MIRTLVWQPDQPLLRGGAEQIEQWRNLPDAFIWIDIYDEPDESDAPLLRELGCHELAISDAQKERHPPKLELFGDETFLLLRDLTADATTLDFNYVQTAFFARSRSLDDLWGAEAYVRRTILNLFLDSRRRSTRRETASKGSSRLDSCRNNLAWICSSRGPKFEGARTFSDGRFNRSDQNEARHDHSFGIHTA